MLEKVNFFLLKVYRRFKNIYERLLYFLDYRVNWVVVILRLDSIEYFMINFCLKRGI